MILQKTVVRSFHRQNAGLYLVILLIAGSFMSGHEHITLARIIMSRPDLLVMASVLWILSTTQSLLFLTSFLRLPANEFLFGVSTLSNKKKWKELLTMQIGLNLFPLTYSIIWLVIGYTEQHYFSIICLLFIHLLLIILPAYRANWLFSRPNQTQNSSLNS